MTYKEVNGVTYTMLETPEPLTMETKLPCLVRLIQDDSPMGTSNKHYFNSDELYEAVTCIDIGGIDG